MATDSPSKQPAPCPLCGYITHSGGCCAECGVARFTALRVVQARRSRAAGAALVVISALLVALAMVLAVAPAIGLLSWSVFYGSRANGAVQTMRHVLCLGAPVVSAVLMYLGVARFLVSRRSTGEMRRGSYEYVVAAMTCGAWGIVSAGVVYVLLAMAGLAG